MAIISRRGYKLLKRRKHPLSHVGGFILEHRLIADALCQGKLGKGNYQVVVHHIDGNKLNNDPSNLQVVTSREHKRLHLGWVQQDGKWFKDCKSCHRHLEVNADNFYVLRGRKPFSSLCKECERTRARQHATAKEKAKKEYRAIEAKALETA